MYQASPFNFPHSPKTTVRKLTKFQYEKNKNLKEPIVNCIITLRLPQQLKSRFRYIPSIHKQIHFVQYRIVFIFRIINVTPKRK
jgi:hypothetical protein